MKLSNIKEKIKISSKYELFYINLDERVDRRIKIEKELEKIKKYKIQRYSAISPKKIDIRDFLKSNIISKNTYINIIKNKIVGGDFLTLGSFCCFLSHINLWKYSVTNNKYLIILEDDVTIDENLEIMDHIESIKNFDMLYLGQSENKWKSSSIDLGQSENVWKLKNDYWGLYGYVINPSYAKKLLDNLKTIEFQADTWLQNINRQLNGEIYLLKKFMVSTDNNFGRDSDCQKYQLKDIKIPKIIHQIWVGPNPIPEKIQNYMKTWKKHYHDWKYILWTDDKVKEFSLVNQKLYDKVDKYAQKADILRYEIIYKYGGFYIDSDFESLKRLDEIISGKSFISGYENADYICNAFFGACKEHLLLKNIIENLEENYYQNIHSQINIQTGPVYFTNKIKQYKSSQKDDDKYEIFIFEPFVLYPYYYNENKPEKYEEYTYAVHHWEKTWK